MTHARKGSEVFARGSAWIAFAALVVSSCVPYTTAYKPDLSARKTYVKVDPSAPSEKGAFLFVEAPSGATGTGGNLGVRGVRRTTGPALEVTRNVEQQYRNYWTPLLIPIGVLAIAELPVMFLMSPLLHSGENDNTMRVWGGKKPKGCELNDFVTVAFTFVVGTARTCDPVGEPKVTEETRAAGTTITEDLPLADLPLRVRLLADGAPLPGGKGERKVVTGPDGRASVPLEPLLSALPDTARSVEVEVASEGGEAAPAKAPLDGGMVESLLGPVREERLGDEAARDGRGLVALEHYAKVLALRKEAPGTTESFRKLASAYRSLPVKPAVPEEVRRLVVQAEALAKENESGRATAKLDEALRAAPWLPPAWYNRAFARAMEKDYGGAIRSMETYLLLAPDAPDARKAKDQVYQWETLVPASASGEGTGGGTSDRQRRRGGASAPAVERPPVPGGRGGR
jgi:hypothetical protein